MPEIRFDVLTQGIPAGDMERADVCSPTADNAVPLVVMPKFVGDASGKIVRLADVYRIPVPVGGLPAEDVDAGPRMVAGANGMEVKIIAFTGCVKPNDRRRS